MLANRPPIRDADIAIMGFNFWIVSWIDGIQQGSENNKMIKLCMRNLLIIFTKCRRCREFRRSLIPSSKRKSSIPGKESTAFRKSIALSSILSCIACLLALSIRSWTNNGFCWFCWSVDFWVGSRNSRPDLLSAELPLLSSCRLLALSDWSLRIYTIQINTIAYAQLKCN